MIPADQQHKSQIVGLRVLHLAVILATVALLLLQTWAVLVFLQHSWLVLQFPYPVDYGEGPLLDQAVRLSQFQNIYRADLSTSPFTISNYPPLYVALQAPFVAVFEPAFWFGRAISILSIICVAGLIALVLRTLTRDWLASAAGGLVFLAIPYVTQWASLFRVDALALALSWSGLFIIVRYPKYRWSFIATSLLLTAAIYTRQSYVLAAPLAAFAWLLLQGMRQRAIALPVAVAGTTLVLGVLLNLATEGGFFFHVVTANVNEFDIGRMWFFMLDLVELMPFLLLAGAFLLLLAVVSRTRSWLLIAAYLVGSAMSGLMIGKVGSNVNYWLEFVAGLSLASGALIAFLRPFPIPRIIVLLLLAMQVNNLRHWTQEGHFHATPSNRAEVMKVVQQSDGPVVTDHFMGLLPLDRRPILIQPFEMMQLAQSRLWDQQPFLDALERQEFATIIISSSNDKIEPQAWTEEMRQTIEKRYKLTNRIGVVHIYEPSP